MMRKLISTLILIFILMITSSCTFDINVNEDINLQPVGVNVEEDEQEVVGFFISFYEDDFDENHVEIPTLMRDITSKNKVLVEDDNLTIGSNFPIVSDMRINDKRSITLDYYLYEKSMFSISRIFKSSSGEYRYEKNKSYTLLMPYETSTIMFKTEFEINNKIDFTINFKSVSDIISYRVIEYDENNEKIKDTTTQFLINQESEETIDFMLDPNTIDFKLIRTYTNFEDLKFDVKELYVVDEIDHQISFEEMKRDEDHKIHKYNINIISEVE